MKWAVCVVAAVAGTGCQALFGLDSPQLAGDAGVVEDMATGSDADAGCVSFSTIIDTCTLTFSSALQVSTSVTYDTDTSMASGIAIPSTLVTTPTGMVRVVALSSYTLANTTSVTFVGSHPMAVIVDGPVTINGAVFARAGQRNTCDAGSGDNSTGGAGGGSGGGFGGSGGAGGEGNADGTGGTTPGGIAGSAASRPSGLVGGCRGGRGGDGTQSGAIGGQGGGALLIAARTSISIAGTINAGGRGGAGAQGTGTSGDGGGGGGGSGGMVVLEAPTLMVSGAVAANGGGGGEGADFLDGVAGEDGGTSTIRAQGGAGGSPSGGNGAGGGASANADGLDADDLRSGGGGGGGGGVGFIAVRGTVTTGGVFSPPYTAWP